MTSPRLVDTPVSYGGSAIKALIFPVKSWCRVFHKTKVNVSPAPCDRF